MSRLRELPWLRITAEGTAIVASILLAFAIDAWWQGRAEQKQASALLSSLHADFVASQRHLDEWVVGNQRILAAMTAMRDRLERTPVGETLEVPREWLLAAVSTPTYSPTDANLQTAISSGQIDLLDDLEIRRQLALWRQQLVDTSEDELLVRQLVTMQIVPALGEQLRLGSVFEFDTILDWFRDRAGEQDYGTARIRATTELEAAIAQRIFYSTFVVYGLEDLHQTQAELLQLLDDDAP